MVTKGLTLREAAQEWVRGFNAIPTQMIAKLWNADPEDGQEVIISDNEDENYDQLPMWGTMWSFGDSIDNYRLEEKDGITRMPQCGFRIFESEEFGYFFGIDGAGYDFYESHWIPLYNERGLKWHDSKIYDI